LENKVKIAVGGTGELGWGGRGRAQNINWEEIGFGATEERKTQDGEKRGK